MLVALLNLQEVALPRIIVVNVLSAVVAAPPALDDRGFGIEVRLA